MQGTQSKILASVPKALKAGRRQDLIKQWRFLRPVSELGYPQEAYRQRIPPLIPKEGIPKHKAQVQAWIAQRESKAPMMQR